MFSSKKAARNRRQDPQNTNTTSRGRPMQQEQAPLREEDMLLFDYGVHNPELMVGDACSGFAPRDLDRLGPQYQATQYPGRTTSSRQGDFPCLPDGFSTTSQPAFPAAIATYPGPQLGATPVDAVAGNWQPNNSLYANNDSPAVSTGSSANVFGYPSQQSTPNHYAGDYVSPTALQHAPQPGFEVYPWPGAGDGSVSLGAPHPGTLTSPALPNFAGTPEGAFSDSDPAMYAEVDRWQQQQQHQQTQGITIKTEPEVPPPRHKRAKKSVDEQSISSCSIPTHPSPISNSKTTTPNTTTKNNKSNNNNNNNNKTKLRSASRASKNTTHRPEETPQERKSRNSHNLVEKQYRNRLNTQFEILMNTLPESMRSGAGTGGGAGVAAGASTSGGESDGPGLGSNGGGVGSAAHHGAFDVGGERRLSKAQVLDMSARYIRSLERERDKLEEDVRRLRAEGRRDDREGC